MNETKKLKGRDLIIIGIFSALYFILNLAAMITGFVPVLWLLLPGVAGVLTGIPFMLMESKVQKPGAILIMGLITAVLYFVTGQFAVLLLITFAVACILPEAYRAITKYDNRFIHMAISFINPCHTKSLGVIAMVREMSLNIDAAVRARVPVVEAPAMPIFSFPCNLSHAIAFSMHSRG